MCAYVCVENQFIEGVQERECKSGRKRIGGMEPKMENEKSQEKRWRENPLSVGVCMRASVVRTLIEIQTDIDATTRCFVCKSMNLRFYRRCRLLQWGFRIRHRYVELTVGPRRGCWAGLLIY